jgi:hypothetical protein
MTVKQWIARELRQGAEWLDPTPATPTSLLVAAAVPLVRAQRLIDSSGESKRHQVYADLIKRFPLVPKRLISRAIEDALDVS